MGSMEEEQTRYSKGKVTGIQYEKKKRIPDEI